VIGHGVKVELVAGRRILELVGHGMVFRSPEEQIELERVTGVRWVGQEGDFTTTPTPHPRLAGQNSNFFDFFKEIIVSF